MMSLRQKLSLLFFSCAGITALLSIVFVNQTIHYQLDQYLKENQIKRNERIVTYFEDLYQKNKGFTEDSGIELLHEAYMNQYCLVLMDVNKNVIWGMNPTELSRMENGNGIYQAKIYELIVDDQLVGYLEIGQHGSLLLSQMDLDFKSSINQSIILSIGFTLIILIGLSLLFSNPLSKQMKQVAQMSRELSQGKFDTRLKNKPNIEEIETIQEGMNCLAIQLQTQEVLRKQLVSDVSHELRTPLNILQTNLEAMVDGIIPLTEERLQSLNQEVIRFGRLLTNLEVLKQVDTTQMPVHLQPLSLSTFLLKMKSDLEALCFSNGILFEMILTKNVDDEILGDEHLLKQVVLNLMSNACKFTPLEGKIQIQVTTDINQVFLRVIDNGQGIDEADLPYVFERFYRGDPSRSQTEGSGIGLSIVAEIIKLHDADITITSHLNQGTVVQICFKKSVFI